MDQADILRLAVGILEKLNIPYMLVGSLASGVYGEARLTQDIDIVIAPTLQQLDQLCAAFPSDDFYVSREAAREALGFHSQFNVLYPTTGDKIDFMIAKSDEWGVEQLTRRERMLLLPDFEGFAARPEDVIISKMQYFEAGGSEKHLRDITSMFKMSGARIDRAYVERWVARLDLHDTWQKILTRLGES